MLCRAVFGRMPKPLKGTTMENSQNSFGSSTQELFIAMVVTLFANLLSLCYLAMVQLAHLGPVKRSGKCAFSVRQGVVERS